MPPARATVDTWPLAVIRARSVSVSVSASLPRELIRGAAPGIKSRGSWLVASSRADDFVANVSGQDLWLTQSSVALAFPLQFESVAYFRVRFVGRSRRVVAFDS